jgi:hypothetical protein
MTRDEDRSPFDCRHCGAPTQACSWSQNVFTEGGDCCAKCEHAFTLGYPEATIATLRAEVDEAWALRGESTRTIEWLRARMADAEETLREEIAAEIEDVLNLQGRCRDAFMAATKRAAMIVRGERMGDHLPSSAGAVEREP